MATELDKLVVKIEADLKDLKKGMAQANKTVKKSTSGMGKNLTKLNSTLNRISTSFLKIGAVAGIAFGVLGIRKVIQTGMEIQKLEIRFNNLFGSVEEGNKAFTELLGYASTVPFSLGQIQAGAGSLAVVSKNAEELRDIMEITGNVAVISGLGFAETASQIQRVFSGGLAAADIFREKGISQIIKDTGMMVDTVDGAAAAFEAVFSGDGRFGKATKEMATTVEGNLSMVGDVIEQFTIAVAEGFFVKLAGGLEDFRKMLNANLEDILAYGRKVGQALGTAFENIGTALDVMVIAFKTFIALKLGIFFVTFSATVLTLKDAFNKLKIAMLANPLFAIATGIAMLVLFKDELAAIKDIIQKFIIDKFDQARIAVERFLNSFKSSQSNFANAAKLVNTGGLSGPERADLLDPDRLSAQEKILLREANKTQKKYTQITKEQSIIRAELYKHQADIEAKTRGELFDKEMEILDNINAEFEKVGANISTAFGEAVVSGKDFKDSMVDIFQSVAQQVVALIFQLRVIDPLLKEIKASLEANQVASSGGGFFGSLIRNVVGGLAGGGSSMASGSLVPMSEPTGSMISQATVRGLAGGGNVNPNMPYMVGERGAEMFVPKSSGTIVPNNQVGRASGGGNIVIEQNLNFATGVSQTVRAEVMNLLPAIQQSTLSAVQDARLRGGTFAKDFGA